MPFPLPHLTVYTNAHALVCLVPVFREGVALIGDQRVSNAARCLINAKLWKRADHQ